ncbi:MAG: metal-dependent hydrolase [Gemmatimonadaceae bacterium]|nr:metal-dependent hydrolase [Gemmatimonadaceae bacterium]
MDNVTHALAGLLMADAATAWIERRTKTPANRKLRRAAIGVGLIAAELPDADLLYSGPVVGMGKLGYLLHHRGHTHTIVFAVAGALLMWWLVMTVRRRAGESFDAREGLPLLVLALAGTLSHLLLDFTNTYGVHPFWPFDNRWVYGDAVFIVEPWLWVVAIPPLLFGARRFSGRVVLSVLLCVILAAAWTLGEMTRTLALVITIATAFWLGLQHWIPVSRRVTAGLVAWGVVELVFAASSGQAKVAVQRPRFSDETVAEVVVSPGAGSPFCFEALVVTLTMREYRVRSATIAPWPNLHLSSAMSPHACRARALGSRFDGLQGVIRLPAGNDPGVTWGEQWSAPRAELIALAASHCEVSGALRFLRVPVWVRESDASVRLSDARFGTGTGGFTDLPVREGPCSLPARAWIPPWTPPRADVLSLPPSPAR